MPGEPRLIIFDLYGTLIQFGIMHHPFRKVMKYARDAGRRPRPDDARKLMTVNRSIQDLFLALGIHAPKALLEQVQMEVEAELEKLTLFDDVIPTLTQLCERDFQIAVCSNLAKPYGEPIGRLLPSFDMGKFLSYEIGHIKPEREIYELITRSYQLAPTQCLFVGDSFHMDYEGPVKFGLQARHLVRTQPSCTHQIKSLDELLNMITH